MGSIARLPAALGTGRETVLLPWHLGSRLLPGNTSPTLTSKGAACLGARPPPRPSLRGVPSLGQEQAERLLLLPELSCSHPLRIEAFVPVSLGAVMLGGAEPFSLSLAVFSLSASPFLSWVYFVVGLRDRLAFITKADYWRVIKSDLQCKYFHHQPHFL